MRKKLGLWLRADGGRYRAGQSGGGPQLGALMWGWHEVSRCTHSCLHVFAEPAVILAPIPAPHTCPLPTACNPHTLPLHPCPPSPHPCSYIMVFLAIVANLVSIVAFKTRFF